MRLFQKRREVNDPPAPAGTPTGRTTLAAGVSCSGGAHALRQWCESPGRILTYRDGDRVKVLAPVPGTAAVLAFDAHRETVLLDNGETLSYLVTEWRPGEPAMQEDDVTKMDGPLLVAAGTLCGGGFWIVGADRRAWALGPGGRVALADEPVPGDGAILAVDVPARVVLLADGGRLESIGGRWCRIGRLPEAVGAIRVVALAAFSLGAGHDVAVGDEVALPEPEAVRLIRAGLVGPVL